ncbi:MAG: CopD family protein [Anaerolineae bacterium]
MPTKQAVFAVVTFLHDLFTATWIGGLLTLTLSVLPAARKLLGKQETQRLMDAIQQRLSVVVYVSIVGLAATGMLLSNRSPDFTSLFGFSTAYSTLLSVKHLAVVAMVAIALVRSLVLPRMQRPAPQRARWSLALLLTNLGLGILVLLLTGFLVALGTTPPGV